MTKDKFKIQNSKLNLSFFRVFILFFYYLKTLILRMRLFGRKNLGAM